MLFSDAPLTVYDHVLLALPDLLKVVKSFSDLKLRKEPTEFEDLNLPTSCT